jgi:hypothetical protein
MAGTKLFEKILHLIPCIGFHEPGLLGRFVAYIFHLNVCFSFRFVHALSQFLLHGFLLSPFDIAWSQIFI